MAMMDRPIGVMITDDMTHGRRPRSIGSREPPRFRSVRGTRRSRQRPSALPLCEQQGSCEWDARGRQFEESVMPDS